MKLWLTFATSSAKRNYLCRCWSLPLWSGNEYERTSQRSPAAGRINLEAARSVCLPYEELVQLRVDRFTVAIFLLTALIAVLLYTILTIPDLTPTPQLPPQLDEVVSA